MKNTTVLMMLLCTISVGRSQPIKSEHKIISSGGASLKNAKYTGSVTIGQPMVGQLKQGPYTTRIGLYGDAETKPPKAVGAAKRSNVAVFPDPAETALKLESPTNEAIMSIEAVDAVGRSTRLSYTRSGSRMQVVVSELPNGSYTLILRTNEGVHASRFVHHH